MKLRGSRPAMTGIAAIALTGMLAAGAAVGLAQLGERSNTVTAANAHELSSVFRDVARKAMPSIVSIEARGKVRQVAADAPESFGDPFGEDSPFRDFFKNDPRLFKQFEDLKKTPRQSPSSVSRGSGFVIDADGVIITNRHVVDGANEVVVKFHDGRELTATKVATDSRTDLAVVHVDSDEPLVALPTGDSDATEIGDWVLAVGSPFGLDMSVTSGIISGKGRGIGLSDREDFLQTDAAINPGNSGGPLLNLNGEVIGVNTAISSRSGGYDGVGFAIPSNMVRWVADQLVEQGEVKRAYLGVSIQPINARLAKVLGVGVGEGVLVGQVMPGTAAEKAGVLTGDVIVELDGHAVTTTRELQGAVERLTPGKGYSMVVVRNGDRETLNVELLAMPEEFGQADSESKSDDNGNSSATAVEELGMEIEPVTEGVAKRFGMDAPTGVLVGKVEEGPAKRAGIRPGSIVLRVGKTTVDSPESFREAMENVSLDDGVLMLVRSESGGQGFVVVQK